MIEKTAPTYQITLYMSGPIEVAKQAIRRFVRRGLCVTIDPTLFVYTGGEEGGFRVGLLNYPRFPCISTMELDATATELAHELLSATEQDSALIVGNETRWITRREAQHAT